MKLEENKLGNSSELVELVNELASSKALKTKSLISTVLGDLAMPYGGLVWVETLSILLKSLNISDRLVRTSIFRLGEDGWLEGTRSGRKSYYGLTELGERQTKLAESLIYNRQTITWDGSWTLVFLVINPVESEARKQLEQELIWIGFGKVSNGVWAHPCIETDVLLDRVRGLNLLDKVICMKCRNIQDEINGFKLNDRDLAINCLPVDNVKYEYKTFIKRFSVFQNIAEDLTGFEMLILRILLIDQYRKIVLHDPNLPLELLSDDWNGSLAFELTGKIYNQLKEGSDDKFIEIVSESDDKLITKFDTSFDNRFPMNR